MSYTAYWQGGLIKNKGGLGLFQISQKERIFISYNNKGLLGGNLAMCPPFLHPPKKTFLPLSLWPRREHTWAFNQLDSLLNCF